MKLFLRTGLGLLAIGTLAFAQSRSSFTPATISGITVTRTNNQLLLNVSATPTIMIGSNVYNVTEVFGVWALDNNDDFSATGGNQNGWKFNSNMAGTGGIAGWKTNPNDGLINSSLAFNYNTVTGLEEAYGYHVRVNGTLPGGGNTGFVTAVPEPASMIALGAGLLALARRRRK
ncbi:MAG TPA: PEP-CTERM sorting domain-containing protein [Fimbriimonadaceae bacterium]|nr:PEP-CTERM sorting domain-containing protein [Fimbriimonadaceae bacterium]HRE92803.1 PEP-CTERM sorting domain-containing protein [Fimbriimonadaceae bacterium]HRI72879.1 PEP-CTERM sorting domain-containing protein [Fimbriimonadaceae bacterium]